jgi:hypothetical protein
MNNRLQQEQSAQAGHTQQSDTRTTKAFENAEEVIRADREQTAVPDSLGNRIADSLSREPQATAPKSWWQRLFGG